MAFFPFSLWAGLLLDNGLQSGNQVRAHGDGFLGVERLEMGWKTDILDAILDWLSRNYPASKSQTGSFKVLAVGFNPKGLVQTADV
jgi:hypothetical protein